MRIIKKQSEVLELNDANMRYKGRGIKQSKSKNPSQYTTRSTRSTNQQWESASIQAGFAGYPIDYTRQEPSTEMRSPRLPRLSSPIPEIPKRASTIIDAPFFYGNPVNWPGEKE